MGRSRQYRSGGAGAAWERRAQEQAEHREQLPAPSHSPPRYATGPCTHAGSPRPSSRERLLPSGPCGCTRARSLRMLPIELVQVREGAHSLLGILLRVRHLSRLDCARQARAKVSLCVEGVGPSVVRAGTALAPALATYADPFFMGLAAGLGLLSCDVRAVACVSAGSGGGHGGDSHPRLQRLGRCLDLAAHTCLEGVDVVHCILPLILIGLLIELVRLLKRHRRRHCSDVGVGRARPDGRRRDKQRREVANRACNS